MNLNPFKRKCKRCEEGDRTIYILTDALLQLKRESNARLREARKWKFNAEANQVVAEKTLAKNATGKRSRSSRPARCSSRARTSRRP